MTYTLYIDIDSTIWPAELEYEKAEMELYGTKLLSTGWYDVPRLIETFGSNYQEIFWKALAPEKVMEREFYPNCLEALYDLYSMGFDIHFITHNPFREMMSDPLFDWLNLSLIHPLELTVYAEHNCKVETMNQDPTAWGIIEDRPSMLSKAVDSGYKAYGKKQVWNQRDPVGGVWWFNDWSVVPSLIEVDLTNELGYATL